MMSRESEENRSPAQLSQENKQLRARLAAAERALQTLGESHAAARSRLPWFVK